MVNINVLLSFVTMCCNDNLAHDMTWQTENNTLKITPLLINALYTRLYTSIKYTYMTVNDAQYT